MGAADQEEVEFTAVHAHGSAEVHNAGDGTEDPYPTQRSPHLECGCGRPSSVTLALEERRRASPPKTSTQRAI